MKNLRLAALFIAAIVAAACGGGSSHKVGETYHGFKLEKKEFVKEMNCDVLQFKHTKSGARLIKVAADDDNKLFSITFFTTPNDDSGVPHIMEHSVLNGSEKFPVKSPFDILIKGSLNTFLNAMTGDDLTTYPVASMNEKDYFNLMDVYLNAVLFPNLRTDDRILKQEGWHYELTDINDEIVYKGVVYNEMKGALSNPQQELNYRVRRELFPDNTYGVESGGYPQAIPTLTQENFVKFHEEYYHPSNSFILLYGNADLDKELAFIDTDYLSKFTDNGKRLSVEPQKPFEAKRELDITYGVPEGANTANNTFLTYSIVTGLAPDPTLELSLDIIADAMVNHETAPLREALREAGIGKDVYAYSRSNRQFVFEIGVTNANPEDKARFAEVVESTMAKVAAEGFDVDAVEGILNRREFRLREGNTPNKGLMALFSTIHSMWFDQNDPISGMRYEKTIAEVKAGVKGTMLQDVVKNNLIGNPHTLVTAMRPEPGKEAKIEAETRKQLAEYKKSLSREQLEQLVEDTKALIEYQKTPDSPEAIASVPMLALSDISTDVNHYEVAEKNISGVKTLHYADFTGNILYTRLMFDLKAIPQELIPYANVLSALLGNMNTENYSYGDLENAVNKHTGGISAQLTSYLENYDDNKLIPLFVVAAKATQDKAKEMTVLLGEIVNTTKYNDIERLKNLVLRLQASEEEYAKSNGRGIATSRMLSYFSNDGMFDEITGGLEYYNFLTDLNSKLNAGKEQEVIDNLTRTAQLLFCQQNLTLGITCSNSNLSAFTPVFSDFVATLPQGDGKQYEWKFVCEPKNEGLITASKVQYVLQGGSFVSKGYKWDGKIRVMSQILSREYLQNTVRVQGGAYGGYCNFSPSGRVVFGSYRDPNLQETFDNYAGAPEYLRTFDADEVEMTRFIIGTISTLEGPTTPMIRGVQAIGNYYTKITKDQRLAERKAVLSTTKEDIRTYAPMVEDVLKENIYCVFGGESKIQQHKQLFKTTYNVVK